ncbi:hypothetical protein GBAR_LOCUS14947 [Geodia barretti]|uniref:Uncharacterized protein n=1 Tax=Geodia barretti TaxID=519541 RepID=A0AA35WR15_GEOBA|nr:hypothetical protein GBAR_LOCUS14947 [Geodia barretti]
MALLKSKVKSFLTGLQKDKVRDDSQINKDDIHQMQCMFPRRCPPKMVSSMGAWQTSSQGNSLCRRELVATTSSLLYLMLLR